MGFGRLGFTEFLQAAVWPSLGGRKPPPPVKGAVAVKKPSEDVTSVIPEQPKAQKEPSSVVPDEESKKQSDRVKDGLRHLNALGEIKARREAARSYLLQQQKIASLQH